MATYVTPDYKIASGYNNAVGLVAWTAIADANSVYFVMPNGGIASHNRGEKRYRIDLTVGHVGEVNAVITFGAITLAQYTVLLSYDGKVTVRHPISGSTFANFNAIFAVPDESELKSEIFSGTLHDSGFTGFGYVDVTCNLYGMVAL